MERAKAAPEGEGDLWTWTAIDSDSKMVISWAVSSSRVCTHTVSLGPVVNYAVPYCFNQLLRDGLQFFSHQDFHCAVICFPCVVERKFYFRQAQLLSEVGSFPAFHGHFYQNVIQPWIVMRFST